MTLKKAFDDFILSRKLADLSPKSIYAYSSFIRPFVYNVGSDKELIDVTQSDVSNYLSSILEKPVTRSTRSTYIRHLKIFLKYCSENYEVVFDYKKIKIPKAPKKVVKIYSDEELQLIFDNINYTPHWVELRNKCIVALMLDSGLRQSEVCMLLRKDILPGNMLVVHGKGNKERTVPLGSVACAFLEEYVRACPFESDRVFVNRNGEILTNNAVKLFIRKLGMKLPFEFSSHKLRHNFATNYCLDQYEQNGHVDIYSLMVLLGHEEIETTRRYLHHANEIIASKTHISHLDRVFVKRV